MIREADYKQTVECHTPRPSYLKNSLRAAVVGGMICAFGELIAHLYIYLGASEKNAYLLVTVSLIFISAALTSFGVYDKIARVGGAGTLVPVTGFANAVVSPALDTRAEGYIFGVGTKIFTVAGPVILYSVVGGTLYGIIYYLTLTFINM